MEAEREYGGQSGKDLIRGESDWFGVLKGFATMRASIERVLERIADGESWLPTGTNVR